jgi:nitroreductase
VSADLEPRILRDLDRYVERGLGGAPLVVVVGVDTAAVHPASAGSSVFPAVQNLCLAAIALGYGSALTSLTVQAAGPVRELLGLPAHVDPVAAVPIGRPARPLGPPRRLPLVARAHRERFGVPWEPEPG